MSTRANQLGWTRNLAIKDDNDAMKVFNSGKQEEEETNVDQNSGGLIVETEIHTC
jgi:hypothetical protein